MQQKTITLPHNYTPRDYQLPLFVAIDGGYKRVVCIWHRRAGKDLSLISLVAKKAFERVGAYYYFFPTYKQGRKILWEGADRDGVRFLARIPDELISRKNDQEMMIELVNGSIIRVIGTDDINSIVGTNPIGCVFSEYSLQNPIAWDFIRPILAENGGWAVFNYTPRGDNHGRALWRMAQKYPDQWFTQLLTVDDTGVIDPVMLAQEKIEMNERTGSDALFLQEYYCSFDAPIEGSYYNAQMARAREEGRIGRVPVDPMLPVHTVWDLGVGDANATWFVQLVGAEIRLVDYIQGSGYGLDYYAQELQAKKYNYGTHIAPHDIKVRELSTAKTRLDIAASLGINFSICPNVPRDDGINAARMIIPRCWFDEEKCEKGISALNSYQKVWDEDNKVFRNTPLHNWASNGADAFRYLAVAVDILSNSSSDGFIMTF